MTSDGKKSRHKIVRRKIVVRQKKDAVISDVTNCRAATKHQDARYLASDTAKYRAIMDHSPIRQNFNFGKKNEIYRNSQKKHFQISKTAKFGCGMF